MKQVRQFFFRPKNLFRIGILILSQLIVGIMVKNLKSTPSSQMMSCEKYHTILCFV